MGIPRLIGHLQPYAITSALGNESVDSSEDVIQSSTSLSPMIIDGPGLVYHLFHRLFGRNATLLKGHDTIPSYTEIGEAFIAFLDLLEAHRCHMYCLFHLLLHLYRGQKLIIPCSSHVYFDGFLPIHKRPTRQARLEKSLRDLVKTHDLNPNGFSVSSISPCPTSKPVDLFNSPAPLPPPIRSVPAPAFLVPGVLDAISRSRYIDLTAIVPGEADPYCALAACDLGGMILTSDSDLLVFDISPRASVVFFKDIELQNDEFGQSQLKANKFHPSSICQRLQLPNLHRLAYEIRSDPTIPFAEALRRSKTPLKNASLFSAFVEEYTLPPSRPVPSKQQQAKRKPRFLDPRLSELILQFPSPSPSSDIHVYLPFLIEDPSRSSVWDISSSIRYYTYFLLASYLAPSLDEPISEISRKGYRVLPITVPLTKSKSGIRLATSLLEKTRARFPGLPPELHHRVFATAYVHQWCVDNDKNPPSRVLIMHALTGDAKKGLKWEFIHLDAQVQGVLYSLRMLKQSLLYLKTSSDGDEVSEEMMSMLDDLRDFYDLIPSLRELHSLSADRDLDVKSLLDFILDPTTNDDDGREQHLPVDERRADENKAQGAQRQTLKKRKGRRTQKTQPDPPAEGGKAKMVNPYDLLAT